MGRYQDNQERDSENKEKYSRLIVEKDRMMPNFLILIKKLMLTVIALLVAGLLIAMAVCAWYLSRFFPQFRNSAVQTDGAPMNIKELIPKDFNPKN